MLGHPASAGRGWSESISSVRWGEECFSLAKENGLVYFPPPWMMEGEETHELVFVIEPMQGVHPDRVHL